MTESAFDPLLISSRNGVSFALQNRMIVPLKYATPLSPFAQSLGGRIAVAMGGIDRATRLSCIVGTEFNPPVLLSLNARWRASVDAHRSTGLPILPWSAVASMIVDSEDAADLIRGNVFPECVNAGVPIRIDPTAFESEASLSLPTGVEIDAVCLELTDRAMAALLLSDPREELVPAIHNSSELADWAIDVLASRFASSDHHVTDQSYQLFRDVVSAISSNSGPYEPASLLEACRTALRTQQDVEKGIQKWLKTLETATRGNADTLKFGDSHNILLRGLMLAALRDSIDRIELARDDSLNAGDTVVRTALFVHGLMIGMGGIDAKLKSNIAWFDASAMFILSSMVPGIKLTAEDPIVVEPVPLPEPAAISIIPTAGDLVAAFAAQGIKATADAPILPATSIYILFGKLAKSRIEDSPHGMRLAVSSQSLLKKVNGDGWITVKNSKLKTFGRQTLIGLLRIAAGGMATPFCDGEHAGFHVRIQPGTDGLVRSVAIAANALRDIGWASTSSPRKRKARDINRP